MKRTITTLKWLAPAIAVCVAASCGSGSGAGSGQPAGAQPGGGGGGATLQATFSSIQDNVFTPRCTSCHIGAAAPQGLRLDEANSFGLLVGVASSEVPSLLRVAPGDPDASYLIQKLEGTAAVGERMPLGGVPLPQADIDVIRQWITDGAMPDMPPAPPSSPIRVTSLSPLPDSTIEDFPASVMAMFDRELDATSVDPTTFVVERSGEDGGFSEGNEVAIVAASVAVSMVNPSAAVFDLTGVAPVEDTYRVRLAGTGGATIRDLDGNALDGEFTGALPSGDGAEGGDFEALFTFATLQPTLESIQNNIFTPTCSTAGCHSGPMSNVLPGGMDLTSTMSSFFNLVDVDSIQVPALKRVAPGDPDASYIIQKLEGTAAQGERMPKGGPFLDQATIDVVRTWIADGANP